MSPWTMRWTSRAEAETMRTFGSSNRPTGGGAASSMLTDRQWDARRSLTDETSTSRPSRMIPTRSQARSTSGRLCDDRKTVRPAALASDTRVRNSRCISGSRPLVGSSMMRSGSSPMNAWTTPTF